MQRLLDAIWESIKALKASLLLGGMGFRGPGASEQVLQRLHHDERLRSNLGGDKEVSSSKVGTR